MEKPYSELVAQAESAVSAVKDPELKRVAFEKVLDDLLSGGSTAADHKAVAPSSVRRPVRRKRQVSNATKAGSKRGGPQAYIEELKGDGFFEKPKTISEVKAELANHGHHIPPTSLSGPLQTLCQKKSLRRNKADGQGNKKTLVYSNW